MIGGTERTVRTPTLELCYEVWGEPQGTPVILLHGFPDDVRAWDGVAEPLAASGCRVLIPYLRGVGQTRFVDPQEPRFGQQAALAQDLLDFMDGLGLDGALLAGYDCGSRAACITAIQAPDRVWGLVSVGGYKVQDTRSPGSPRSAEEERAYWYQWYFNLDKGRIGLETNRREICRLLWEEWSPTWMFDPEAFDRTTASFDNPDFVPVVIDSYRHRHGNAPGHPRFEDVVRHLSERPSIEVPSVVLHGAKDTVSPPYRSESHMTPFPPDTPRRVVPGAGHLLPRERPGALVDALLELLEPNR